MKLRALTFAPALLLLAACGGGTGPDASEASTTGSATSAKASPETAAASPSATLSARGNYVARIGEPVAAGDLRGDKPAVTWTITGITVDASCETSISKPAENGHIVVVSVDAETAEGFDEDVTLPGGFHPRNNWSITDSGGYTRTDPTSDASLYCIDTTWPREMVPASKYRFRVAFDSDTPSGVLQYRAPNWSNGWEWQFG